MWCVAPQPVSSSDNVVYVIVLDHSHCDDFCGNVCVCLDPLYNVLLGLLRIL